MVRGVIARGLAIIAALVAARLLLGAVGGAAGLPSAVADLLTAAALVVTSLVVVRRVAGRAPAELARPAASQLASGALMGVLLFGVTAGTPWLVGSLDVTGEVSLSAVWPALAAAAVAAVHPRRAGPQRRRVRCAAPGSPSACTSARTPR